MTDISIMVMPSDPADVNAPAQIYVLRQGAWREIPIVGRVGMGEIRQGIQDLLNYVMSEIEAGRTIGALAQLRGMFQSQWSHLIPTQLADYIATTMAGSTEPVRFLVNSHKMFEWLPWELLHDGSDWLGVKCQMARLPIVSRGPEQLNIPHHRVRRVECLLGAEVLAEPYAQDPDYDAWLALFKDEEATNYVQVARLPANGSSVWPTSDDFQKSIGADIIHLTCHGGEAKLAGGPYLTLDGRGWMLAGVTERTARQLRINSPGPLIFANACGVVPASERQDPELARGLGVAFYDTGASAYIGAISKISRSIAFKFAQQFYKFLLVEGESVGEALRHTKQCFAESQETDPSWLFYCLYGSPDTHFIAGEGDG